MKKLTVMVVMVSVVLFAVAASAGIEQAKVIPVPYGNSYPSYGCDQTYPGYGTQYPTPGCGTQYPTPSYGTQYPQYPTTGYGYGTQYPTTGYGYGTQYPTTGYGYGCMPNCGGSYNNYGCGTMTPQQQYQYCSKWIPGHWVKIQMIVPGQWVYRPVWIPAHPVSKNQWVAGYWQTTASSNMRPDVYVWNSPKGEWYGMPVQSYQQTSGGYFTPNGVWIPPTSQTATNVKPAEKTVQPQKESAPVEK